VQIDDAKSRKLNGLLMQNLTKADADQQIGLKVFNEVALICVDVCNADLRRLGLVSEFGESLPWGWRNASFFYDQGSESRIALLISTDSLRVKQSEFVVFREAG
jgi:hypothetical protein